MTSTTAHDRRDALVERLFGATIGTLELFGVYLGDRLGLYAALAGADALDRTTSHAEPGSRLATRASGWNNRQLPASSMSRTRRAGRAGTGSRQSTPKC